MSTSNSRIGLSSLTEPCEEFLEINCLNLFSLLTSLLFLSISGVFAKISISLIYPQ